MGRKAEGPPKRDISEIDMALVEKAQMLRAQGISVPPSREAIELVRYLRAQGKFDGNGSSNGNGHKKLRGQDERRDAAA